MKDFVECHCCKKKKILQAIKWEDETGWTGDLKKLEFTINSTKIFALCPECSHIYNDLTEEEFLTFTNLIDETRMDEKVLTPHQAYSKIKGLK